MSDFKVYLQTMNWRVVKTGANGGRIWCGDSFGLHTENWGENWLGINFIASVVKHMRTSMCAFYASNTQQHRTFLSQAFTKFNSCHTISRSVFTVVFTAVFTPVFTVDFAQAFSAVFSPASLRWSPVASCASFLIIWLDVQFLGWGKQGGAATHGGVMSPHTNICSVSVFGWFPVTNN